MSGTTTASYITDTAFYQPFYYLKITGLPYYFFSTIDPTSSTFGSAAWSLSTGYTAVRGMQLPEGSLDQALPDLIGGIASAERIRLGMLDFQVVDANGAHSFFGRLLAPGRLTTSSSAAIGTLDGDILASSVGGTFQVQNVSAHAFAAADTYIGGETIGVSGVSGPSGVPSATVLTVLARNKYPCTASYPPTPYHRVVKDAGGNAQPSNTILVTQEPLTFIGRTAALYIGHMTPDGKPEPEANALCRMIGRITGIDYGRSPGLYELAVESIMGDLANARVAPGLAHAEISPGFYLPTTTWCHFGISAQAALGTTTYRQVSKVITIATGTYIDIKDLLVAVNAALLANPLSTTDGGGSPVTFLFQCHTTGSGSEQRVVFSIDGSTTTGEFTFTVANTARVGYGSPTSNVAGQLLRALGFDAGIYQAPTADQTDTNKNAHASILADKPIAKVFVPCIELAGNTVSLNLLAGTDANGDHFVTSQGDAPALVRFGNGEVMQVTAHAAASLTLSEVNIQGPGTGRMGCYYATYSEAATVDQVIRAFPNGSGTSGERFYARMLCSTTGEASDIEYNVYPEGTGLGLNSIVDKTSFRKFSFAFPLNNFKATLIDGSMTFGTLWAGVSKEAGLFLVWDPSVGQITLRSIQQPSSGVAATFQFDETNRPATGDRTQASVDFSNIRTGLTFKYGWDPQEKKFTGRDITVTDYWAVSAYQIASRVETISDVMIPAGGGDAAKQLTGLYLARSQFTRYPWIKATRSVNKRGLLLAPGSYHKIIDSTIINPFTGLMGIATGDNVYGWLMAVQSNLADGSVRATFLLDQVTDGDGIRTYSPTALLDFSATANGYVTSTGVVTLDRWYVSDSTFYDGYDFEVGDTIALIPWDNDGAPSYEKTSTITAVAVDGHTVTVGSGLGAVSTTAETIMILRPYGSATTSRKTGASKVAFQGSGDTLLVTGTVKLHKWS